MTPPAIPIIDFSHFATLSDEIAKQVFDACTTKGFFYVSNHGIPKEKIDGAFALSKRFYDLPAEEKIKFSLEDNRGYLGLYIEKLDPDQRRGEHKEAFNFGVFHNDSPYPWPLPDVFLENVNQLKDFSKSCNAVAMQILETMAMALEIPKEEGGRHWFTRRHARNGPNSAETLRFLKYPRGSEEMYKESVRAGAHTDYGTITLLFQKDIGGLEVQASRAEWISAPIIDGTILVNVGGMFEYWTNGLFKSTLHRVVFKPEQQFHDRYSIACFLQADADMSLDPVPSSVIPTQRPVFAEIPPEKADKIKNAADYLQMRLDAAYG